MKKLIALSIVVIVLGLNFAGILSLKDYISYSASLVKNKEISVIAALEYEASEFNDYEDAKSLENVQNHINNILHRSSNDPVNKMIYIKVLGDIYGDLNYEYLNGKLKISPSSWGLNGKRVPEDILDLLDEKSTFWNKADDLYKMAILHLATGNNEEAYEYIYKANEIEEKEEFKLIMAAILTEMKNIEESNVILGEIENFEEASSQLEIYNAIVSGDNDTLDMLTGYVKKRNSFSKKEYEDYFRKGMHMNHFRNQYLKILDSLNEFNRQYLISMYDFDDNSEYRIQGRILNDNKALKNTMVQIGNHDYFSSMHLDENTYVGYTDENGEFEIYVPEDINYRITVLANLGDVKGKMCRMPKYVRPDQEDIVVEFSQNDYDLQVIDKGESLELSWNDMKKFDNYSVLIGSMKNGHPYNPEFYSKAIKGNSITLLKDEIIEQSYSRSYSHGDDGRNPNSFFPVLILKGNYFVDIRGNVDDDSITQMDSNINGLYGEDKTFKLSVENDIKEADKLFLDKKYTEAFSLYEDQAANGDIHSITMLGHIYSYDDKLSGMEEKPYNPEKAIKYLKMADEYRYNKYGESLDDYKLYKVYYDQGDLQGFVDYMNRFDKRYGYEYSLALFNLNKYTEGYESLLEHAKSENKEWLIKNLIESGLFYIEIDRIKADLKDYNSEKYSVIIDGLDSIDKNESTQYQELIKTQGLKNVSEISIESSDTGKLYRALLRMNNGPYSNNDLDDIVNSIDNESLRSLGEYLTN